MTDRIRFVQHVYAEILAGNFGTYTDWWYHTTSICTKGRGSILNNAEGREEYKRTFELFVRTRRFGKPIIILHRGEIEINVTLEAERDLLIEAWEFAQVELERRQNEKIAKEQQEKLDAEWWP